MVVCALGWYISARPTLFQQLVHGLAGHDSSSQLAQAAGTYGRIVLSHAFEWAERNMGAISQTAFGSMAMLGRSIPFEA